MGFLTLLINTLHHFTEDLDQIKSAISDFLRYIKSSA